MLQSRLQDELGMLAIERKATKNLEQEQTNRT